VVAVKPWKLSTVLSLVFAGLYFAAVATLALVVRLGIEANFQSYLDTAQAASHGRIMGALEAVHPAGDSWDTGQLAALGRQALTEGLVVTIRDAAGRTVWDARQADPAAVDQAFHDLEGRLQARIPWARGRWEASEHTVGAPGTGATMVLEVFQPRRLGSRDLAFLQSIDALLAAAALAGLVLSALAGIATARRLVRPLGTLRDLTGSLAAGDYGVTVPVQAPFAEVRDLETSVGTLAHRLARLQTLRDTAGADTAHELRTPLANLEAQLEALEDGVLPPSPGRFASLGAEVRRLKDLVQAWEDLERARLGPPEPAWCTEPGAVAQRVIDSFQTRAADRRQSLTFHQTTPVPGIALGDAEWARVVVNLVENAHRYAPEGGRIAVTLSGNPGLVFTVDDDGPGIGLEHREAVFDRFYRADPSRSRASGGLGLGLSLVKTLVTGAGGRVEALESPWTGCRIVVQFGP